MSEPHMQNPTPSIGDRTEDPVVSLATGTYEAGTGEVRGGCPMDNHDGSNPSNDDQHAVMAAIESIIGDIAEHERRIGPRWRRIVRALHGLGLLDVLGRDWVRITPQGLAFAEITAAEADRLARRLEDLENGQRPTPSITPPPDHPRFEFPQPMLPLSTGISPHHLEEWR